MRSDILRVYKSLHTWTGIIAGMALFIAFYAGSLTVFKEPIARWAAPPSPAAVITGQNFTELQQAPELIRQTLAQHPSAGKSFFIHLKTNEQHQSLMQWQEFPEGADDHNMLAAVDYTSTLDEHGNALIQQQSDSKLGEFLDVLHRVVGLPLDIDPFRWVMGIIAILYVLALVSGLIVLLPTLTKDFFALRLSKKNLKRQWLDAHNVVGIASLPFHLVMALTAAVFAYHDFFYDLQDQMIHEKPLAQIFRAGAPAPMPQAKSLTELLPVEGLLQRVKAESPDFEPTMLQYTGVTTPRAMVRVWGFDDRTFSSRAWGGFAVMNPFSGDIISTDFMPARQNAPDAVISSIFSLHMATFGGTPVRWLYFIMGLAGAWLFFSGNLLWVESRRKKQRRGANTPEQRKDTTVMAALTIGVCVGSVAGISFMLVMSKWLSIFSASETLNVQLSYYAVFFAFIVWAFCRGAARSVVPQLWLTALFTAAIPASSVLGWLLPDSGLWMHTSVATLGVDLTAFVGSLCFVWMAVATSKRVHNGHVDSVWSITSKEEPATPIAV